ncbi:MAG: tRNA (N(6)-L-threonylcarbamoyladenosine(37)-C(2))-methylthiotransferase MtaB [Bacilli bacterium]|nr:tRNA (N(6)-L-threonylcarbamoyladenosine(37)-C(2))-methylthiotransferase MtaB [Bacilli bacterium]
MKFSIITFGCKVNSYESEFMKEQLINNNFNYVDDYHDADIVIVNTCSVTNTADNKCKKAIRGVRRDLPEAVLMVCGCTAENHREELTNLDIDILIGNKEKSKVVELIKDYLVKKDKYIKFYDDRRTDFENMTVKKYDDLTRAFVKIQDGCNNYCAYCIIPYVRGSIRSKKMEDVLEEVKELVEMGHHEIVLTGINTGAYGKETGLYDLTDLIREMSKIEGLDRIRVSSIEMTEINDKFIDELKNNKKLCAHLHVSLQSGSERMLKLMNRKYTKDEYYNNILKIKEARPDINLTTDVIVGFPGETEEDFLECIDYCKKIEFSKIHVFPYSVREGTKAATMKDQLSNAVKKERSRRLIEIDNDLQLKYNEKFVGRVVNVLIEEVFDDYSIGHTENFLKVVVNKKLEENKSYDVLIKKAEITQVIGDLN